MFFSCVTFQRCRRRSHTRMQTRKRPLNFEYARFIICRCGEATSDHCQLAKHCRAGARQLLYTANCLQLEPLAREFLTVVWFNEVSVKLRAYCVNFARNLGLGALIYDQLMTGGIRVDRCRQLVRYEPCVACDDAFLGTHWISESYGIHKGVRRNMHSLIGISCC